jgi:hypothetical protein
MYCGMPGTPFLLRPCFGAAGGGPSAPALFSSRSSVYSAARHGRRHQLLRAGVRFIAHDADVPGSRMFPDFSIIQRYQRNTPIIAKCENNREQGTATRSFWETIGDEAFFAPLYLPYVGKKKSCRRWIALQR